MLLNSCGNLKSRFPRCFARQMTPCFTESSENRQFKGGPPLTSQGGELGPRKARRSPQSPTTNRVTWDSLRVRPVGPEDTRPVTSQVQSWRPEGAAAKVGPKEKRGEILGALTSETLLSKPIKGSIVPQRKAVENILSTQ